MLIEALDLAVVPHKPLFYEVREIKSLKSPYSYVRGLICPNDFSPLGMDSQGSLLKIYDILDNHKFVNVIYHDRKELINLFETTYNPTYFDNKQSIDSTPWKIKKYEVVLKCRFYNLGKKFEIGYIEDIELSTNDFYKSFPQYYS